MLSADHDYGPSRFQIFIDESELSSIANELNQYLRSHLPKYFEGFCCSFGDVTDDGSRIALRIDDENIDNEEKQEVDVSVF